MSNKIIVCANCGKEKKHLAHGLCGQCYKWKRFEDNPELYITYAQQQKSWYENNKERLTAASRTRKVKAKLELYGVSEEQYNLDMAKGCAICGGYNALCIDHNHVTITYRGVLCRLCNSGIGALKDDPILLSRAIEYLKK